jgi:hypothetical protein
MDSVSQAPILPSPNELSGGTACRQKESQIEGGPWTYVAQTGDIGSTAATFGTEADRNSNLKAAVDPQLATSKSCAVPMPTK